MLVKEIMNSDVIYCSPEDKVSDAARSLKNNDISGMPVVDNGKIVGILSEVDLLALLEIPEHGDFWLPSPFEVIEIPIREFISWEDTKKMLSDVGSMPVSKIMRSGVFTVSPEDSIENASHLMSKHKINRLPVVENDKIAGIITRGDIIRGIGSL